MEALISVVTTGDSMIIWIGWDDKIATKNAGVKGILTCIGDKIFLDDRVRDVFA
jgi:hypothetical protein